MRFLDDIGLLSPRLTVAHGVHLADEECALMAERGVTVAVNTACNLRLRSGVAPVGRFSVLGRVNTNEHGHGILHGWNSPKLNTNVSRHICRCSAAM